MNFSIFLKKSLYIAWAKFCNDNRQEKSGWNLSQALDTSEKDRALKDLEKEKEGRRKAEMEAAELRLKYQMSVEEGNKLRAELEGLKQRMRLVG